MGVGFSERNVMSDAAVCANHYSFNFRKSNLQNIPTKIGSTLELRIAPSCAFSRRIASSGIMKGIPT